MKNVEISRHAERCMLKNKFKKRGNLMKATSVYFLLMGVCFSQLNFDYIGRVYDVRNSNHSYQSSTFPNDSYIYGPSIIFENNQFHMFSCTMGEGDDWDFIRYSTSYNGQDWSPARILLRPGANATNHASCDPSVVYYDGWYYMYYTGSIEEWSGVIYVARSQNIGGPYLKRTQRGTWELDPMDAQVIVRADVPTLSPGKTHCGADPNDTYNGCYGAGQQTVVVRNNQIHLWYTNATQMGSVAGAPGSLGLRLLVSADPTFTGVNSVGAGPLENLGSVDVKWDPISTVFWQYFMDDQSLPNTVIRRKWSNDGTIWTNSVDLFNPPRFSHNLGVSGDNQGHLIGGRALIAYGSPMNTANLNWTRDEEWGRWDLHATIQNSFGQQLVQIPWEWHWSGMNTDHEIIVGDYDGDGITDRAIVDRANGNWYVIGSETSAPLWDWPYHWSGMNSNHEVIEGGDYDGDGITDRAIVDRANGNWFVIGSRTSGSLWGWPYHWNGMNSNHEVIEGGDYDGDGITDRAIVDRANGNWFVIGSRTSEPLWGWPYHWNGMNSNHEIVVADFDGDGVTDRAIVNRQTSDWYVISSATGEALPDFDWGWHWDGMNSDHEIVVGDYDWDGKADRAIVDGANGNWYVMWSATNGQGWAPYINWEWHWDGMNSDHEIVVGDFDGDFVTDRAIVNRQTSNWYIIGSQDLANGITKTIQTIYPSATPLAPEENAVLNTTSERWYVVSGPIDGWQASEMTGRTIQVNGFTVTAGEIPLPDPVNGNYYFHFSGGDHSWASWGYWTYPGSQSTFGGKTFELKFVHSSKCLDAFNTFPGANVGQWYCHGGDNQKWLFNHKGSEYYEVVDVRDNLCLEVYNGSSDPTANIQVGYCDGNNKQLFRPVKVTGSKYNLKNKNSGLVVDIESVSQMNGANALQYFDNGQDNQKLFFTEIE